MIKDILSYIRKNGRILGLSSEENLTFIQLMLSRGKKYEKGRVVYAIFGETSPVPILYAKVSRDPSSDSSLESEYACLLRLRALSDPMIDDSTPAPLQLVTVADRLVLFESPLPGSSVVRLLSRPIELAPRIEDFTEAIIKLTGEWLSHFQRVTACGTETIGEHFITSRVKPILDRYLHYVGRSETSEKMCSILLSRLQTFGGTTLRMVMTNGNLAPHTILVDNQPSRLGLPDWKFCDTTSLVLREHYCFAQYMFYEWSSRGLLGPGDVEKHWTQTFINADNFLGEGLSDFIQKTNRSLGIAKELEDVMFPLFMINELNVQMEFSQFVPDPRMMTEHRLLDSWMRNASYKC